jgi:hypothetical protein
MRGVFAALPVADAAQILINLGLLHRENEWQPYWHAWLDWMRQQEWRRFGLRDGAHPIGSRRNQRFKSP